MEGDGPTIFAHAGDVLVVTRLDRLARSTRDLLNVLDEIGERGAGFRSLKDAWADTTTPHGKLMVTVLGGLAEFERDLIRARTGEGRKRAKERGVRFGRPRKSKLAAVPARGFSCSPAAGAHHSRRGELRRGLPVGCALRVASRNQ